MKIARIYQRRYSDSGQSTVYVDWSGGGRTECPAKEAFTSPHFASLIARAWREGLQIEQEVW